jgi:hypothetical protein
MAVVPPKNMYKSDLTSCSTKNLNKPNEFICFFEILFSTHPYPSPTIHCQVGPNFLS